MSHPGAVTDSGCDICGSGSCNELARSHPFLTEGALVAAQTIPAPHRIEKDGFVVFGIGEPMTVEQALEHGVIKRAPAPEEEPPRAVERVIDEHGFVLYNEGDVMTAEHAAQYGSTHDVNPTKRDTPAKRAPAKKPAAKKTEARVHTPTENTSKTPAGNTAKRPGRNTAKAPAENTAKAAGENR